jgi:hypothetical protein
MKEQQTNQDPKPTNDRRKFLKITGTALLASAGLPKAAQAAIETGPFVRYTGGVVSNPDLPSPNGELVLNVYLAVETDGTGVGTLSDPVRPTVNSHLAVQQFEQQGQQVRYEGVVTLSNTAAQVGQRFVITGTVQENFTSLSLQLGGATYTGKGFIVTAASFAGKLK